MEKFSANQSNIRLGEFDILQRFALLEETFQYNYLSEVVIPPEWIFPDMNIPELNKITQFIMSIYGFKDIFPICGFGETKADTAGHTEFIEQSADDIAKYGKAVVITISADAKRKPDRILSILAHELCHNILRLKNFPVLRGIENEIYTDLATIYFGLGKYILRGHKIEKVETRFEDGLLHMKKDKSTVGYLTEATYSRAYVLNQLFRGYKDYSGLSKKEITNLKAQREQSEFINIRRLLSKTGKKRTAFRDVFKVCCPQCKYVSTRPLPNLYGKKVKCKNCGHEFIFEWEFPLKEKNGAWIHSNNPLYYLYMCI